MSYRKFGKNDVLINTMTTNPRSNFYIYSGTIFYNNRTSHPGEIRTGLNNVYMTEPGYVNLYEYNIDRVAGTSDLIYPFLVKDGSRAMFFISSSGPMSMEEYAADGYGDVFTGSYPQFASIKRRYIINPSQSCGERRRDHCDHVMAYWSIRNVLNHYTTISPHYAVKHGTPPSYTDGWDKDNQNLNLIYIIN